MNWPILKPVVKVMPNILGSYYFAGCLYVWVAEAMKSVKGTGVEGDRYVGTLLTKRHITQQNSVVWSKRNVLKLKSCNCYPTGSMLTGSASFPVAKAVNSMTPLIAEMAAQERVSATTFSLPSTCQMSMVYSEIATAGDVAVWTRHLKSYSGLVLVTLVVKE